MLIENKELLCFDDVLLRPNFSDIDSRRGVNLETQIAGIPLKYPIVSANMDSVTEWQMAKAMHICGCIGILHRYATTDEVSDWIKSIIEFHATPIPSIGTNAMWNDVIETYRDLGVKIVCVDVAHGHSERVSNIVGKVKRLGMKVIAGNVATYEGAKYLATAGADVIKVGIGPGSLCTTRIVTGHGVPQLSAIIDCCDVKKSYPDVTIIADGGIRNSGDIVKALAAGADAVMIGRLFAGCSETPGITLGNKKVYRGMASHSAQMDYRGKVNNDTPEGEFMYVDTKGPVGEVVTTLVGGIRSGLSYSGACSLKELRESAIFLRVSQNTVAENVPRIL